MLGFNFNSAVKYIFLCLKNSISHTLPYLKTKEKKIQTKDNIKKTNTCTYHVKSRTELKLLNC